MTIPNIANLIATNAAVALTLIKQWVGQPNVGGMSIKTTRFDCIMDAEVSRHVLINLAGGLQSVMDNVAPGPRTWEIEGTVGGFPGEMSSLFMPSIRISVEILDRTFQARQQTTLLDPDFRSFNVFISHFEYSYDPTVQNRIHVKLSLVEVFILQASTAPLGTVPAAQQSASPAAGGIAATAASLNAGASTSQISHFAPRGIPGFTPQ
jgi:hypothetical protein